MLHKYPAHAHKNAECRTITQLLLAGVCQCSHCGEQELALEQVNIGGGVKVLSCSIVFTMPCGVG
jgi:hypothetical protein